MPFRPQGICFVAVPRLATTWTSNMAARGCVTPAESPQLLVLVLLSAVPQIRAEPGEKEMEN